ncbi:MAG: hypothetical protein BGO43_08340 [Gammaproteobacteria bacterium 39-13]|nr:hypothetical protein [Gammaproteobacteria bacterium]OJV91680.1 MAG: hypothetical protein BGO43_08340 [Gammaproteobacteria bacterium 39-13]
MRDTPFFSLKSPSLVITALGLGLIALTYRVSPTIHLPASEQILKIGLKVDPLASVMLVVVALLATVVLCYSKRYLLSDVTRTRFICQMLATVMSVVFFTLASNLFTAFIAWQWIGFNLYLLLNHYHYQSQANRAAKKKFIVNRIGDMSFLLAVILCYQFYGTSEYHELAAITSTQLSLFSFTLDVHSVILGLVFVAIMTKSAQFPFHFWLPDTMQAPTPVSALMHAGVINAGGILLARLSFVFTQTGTIAYIILCVGMISMIVGGFLKQVQPDVKKKLAYSTMSQMGYMLMQSSLGCFAAAVFHLIAHGFYKAALFLNAGNDLFKNTKNKMIISNPLSLFTQGVVLTLAMLWIANEISHQTQSSLLILTFIGITLHQIIMTTLQSAQFVLRVLVLAALQIILVGYLWMLNAFESWIEIPKLILINQTIEYVLCTLVLLWYLASSLITIKGMKKRQWLIACHFKLAKLLQVEDYFRGYFLNPLRRLGDWLNQNLFDTSTKRAIFIIVSFLISILTCIENCFYVHYMFCMDHLLITALVLSLLMANRAQNLFQLGILLCIAHICLLTLDFTYIKAFNLKMALSSSMIIFGLGWLISQTNHSSHKRLAVSENRLTLWGFYLSVSLFLLIGIPGTASFIFWFNLITHATTNYFIALGLMTANILLSVVVLHALQDYVFKLHGSHEIAENKKIHTHIIFASIIVCNLYFGMF